MNSIVQLLAQLQGRRTYIVAGCAAAYLIICQFTGKLPDESILGIFMALGLATLRASLSTNGQAANQAPPANNGTNGTKLLVFLLCFTALSLMSVGCVLNRPRLSERNTTTLTNGVVIANEKNMKVTSFVLWPAKETVANQKASISAKTMSTGVDSLQQEGGGTNVVDALKEINSILSKVRP